MPMIRPITDLQPDCAALADLYEKLAVAEHEIADGAKGEDFLTVARQLRERVHGRCQ